MATIIELADPTTAMLPKKTKKELIQFINQQAEFYFVVEDQTIKMDRKMHQQNDTISQLTNNLKKARAGLASAKVMLKSIMGTW